MTDDTRIELIAPSISGRGSGIEKSDSDDPVPLLGKASEDSGGAGLVDTSSYPNVDVHVNVDHGTEGLVRFERDQFTLYEDGEEKEVERFEFLGDEVDLVFVFDDTGSMSDEIEGAKDGVRYLTDEIHEQDMDARYGLVTFKDDVEVDVPLTSDAEHLKSAVDELEARGGGDVPEANFDAVERALDMNLREDAHRVLVDITDAPSHYRDDHSRYGEYLLEEVADDLQQEGVTFVAVSPDKDHQQRSVKTLASEVSGFWTDIMETRSGRTANFEEVLERISELLVSTYAVGFHTCTPPGQSRELEVAFDHPKYGSDAATTSIDVPERYDLPPECAEEEADTVTKGSGKIDSKGSEKIDSKGSEKIDTAPKSLFIEADQHVVSPGDPVKFTVRADDGDRISGATVTAGDVEAETNRAGYCEISFEEVGPKTVTATSPTVDDEVSITIEVEGASEPEPVDHRAGGIGRADGDEESVPLVLDPSRWMVDPGEEVKFTVMNIDGDRIENAVVETPTDEVETNTVGTCNIRFDEAGSVEVTARKEGNYEPDTVEISVVE